jgi:O-succinylbenzoate synthase
LADYQRLPEFGALTGFPLALDESLQVPDCHFEPFTALVAIVVKPMLAGGIVPARRLIKKAQHEGLRAIVSASYESPQGMQQLAWLAATDTPGELPGLDTLRAFDDTAVVHFKQCLQQGVKTGQFQTLEKVWQSTAAH